MSDHLGKAWTCNSKGLCIVGYVKMAAKREKVCKEKDILFCVWVSHVGLNLSEENDTIFCSKHCWTGSLCRESRCTLVRYCCVFVYKIKWLIFFKWLIMINFCAWSHKLNFMLFIFAWISVTKAALFVSNAHYRIPFWTFSVPRAGQKWKSEFLIFPNHWRKEKIFEDFFCNLIQQ